MVFISYQAIKLFPGKFSVITTEIRTIFDKELQVYNN